MHCPVAKLIKLKGKVYNVNFENISGWKLSFETKLLFFKNFDVFSAYFFWGKQAFKYLYSIRIPFYNISLFFDEKF